MYADLGPLSNDRPCHLESAFAVTLDFNEQRVEYAQVNHMAQNSKPVPSVDKSANDGTILYGFM